MAETLRIERTTTPRARPNETDLGFGRQFTDHMLVVEYDEGRGWHSPRIVPYGPIALDPAAAVLHYGQELFEGMKAFRGKDGNVRLFRPDKNCRRMNEGAARLCMPEFDPAWMEELITELIRVEEDWVPRSPGTALYIRPTMIATEPFLGVRPSKKYTFFVILSPVGSYFSGGMAPVKIWVEPKYVRAARGGLGAVKTGANYAASLLAAEQAKKAGYAQVLWLDAAEHRWFEEVGTMNLFVKIGDEIVTPPLGGSILDGVTRDSVITLLRDWGMKVVERPIAIEEIATSFSRGELHEIFGTGTAAVISPVKELAFRGESFVVGNGEIGPVARRLYDTITGIQAGTLADPHEWVRSI
ncbi:branched-chain amino acid aminotransferase [Vulgatibacter sp.]|uniref:branched-chain amino acid aminotransferase n=1 Tax=Vulgatibacter sp. TaxID=1971226 RepID=UPI0035625278